MAGESGYLVSCSDLHDHTVEVRGGLLADGALKLKTSHHTLKGIPTRQFMTTSIVFLIGRLLV